jgi:signal peptidase I
LSKIVTRILPIALGLLLVSTVVFYIEINPNVISGQENVQVFLFVSSSMEPTIIQGNYILVDKQINARELSADYPNSDIIAFHKPENPEEIIVHRIVAEEEREGILYFYTKGDANGLNKYPEIPTPSDYDPWNSRQGISENLVVGKVVDNNYPIMLLNSGFWLTLIVSAVLGIVLIALYFSNRSKKNRNRIRQLEERLEKLERKESKN